MSIQPKGLHEIQPKNNGFRVIILNPLSLYQFARSSASRSSDLPSKYYNTKSDEAFLADTTRNWNLGYWYDKNALIKDVSAELIAMCEPDSGEWASIYFNIDLTDYAHLNNWAYQIPQNHTLLIEYLRKRGLYSSLNPKIELSNPTLLFQDGETNFELGYIDENIARHSNLDKSPTIHLKISIDKLDLKDKKTFVKQLERFAAICSWSVEGIYDLFGFKSPDFELKLAL